MKNADLHSHSYYSDGLLSPTELVRKAKEKKIKHLALTDHDSVAGVKEAINEGKKIGVDVIPAIELRSDSGEILGYFIDIENKELVEELRQANSTQERNAKEWIDKLEKLGFDVSYDELKKKYPHSESSLKFYVSWDLHKKTGRNFWDIRKEIRVDKQLAPKQLAKRNIISAIRLVINAGGIPILAHPWLENFEEHMKNMDEYVKEGLKGLEINNGDDEKSMIKFSGCKDVVKKIKETAEKHGLIATSGSDYHSQEVGDVMPGRHFIGEHNCDEEVVERLRKLSESSRSKRLHR